MVQTITLNVPYELSDADWEKVAAVYRSMDGWIEEHASWFGPCQGERYIVASAEPSGLLLEGNVDPDLFREWVTMLCARLTAALGRDIHDAEL